MKLFKRCKSGFGELSSLASFDLKTVCPKFGLFVGCKIKR